MLHSQASAPRRKHVAPGAAGCAAPWSAAHVSRAPPDNSGARNQYHNRTNDESSSRAVAKGCRGCRGHPRMVGQPAAVVLPQQRSYENGHRSHHANHHQATDPHKQSLIRTGTYPPERGTPMGISLPGKCPAKTRAPQQGTSCAHKRPMPRLILKRGALHGLYRQKQRHCPHPGPDHNRRQRPDHATHAQTKPSVHWLFLLATVAVTAGHPACSPLVTTVRCCRAPCINPQLVPRASGCPDQCRVLAAAGGARKPEPAHWQWLAVALQQCTTMPWQSSTCRPALELLAPVPPLSNTSGSSSSHHARGGGIPSCQGRRRPVAPLELQRDSYVAGVRPDCGADRLEGLRSVAAWHGKAWNGMWGHGRAWGM